MFRHVLLKSNVASTLTLQDVLEFVTLLKQMRLPKGKRYLARRSMKENYNEQDEPSPRKAQMSDTHVEQHNFEVSKEEVVICKHDNIDNRKPSGDIMLPNSCGNEETFICKVSFLVPEIDRLITPLIKSYSDAVVDLVICRTNLSSSKDKVLLTIFGRNKLNRVNRLCIQSRTISTSASDRLLDAIELLCQSVGTRVLQNTYSTKTTGNEKMKKCFLPTKVRLAAALKCAPRPPPCPVPERCIRADENLCVRPKKLPKIEPGPCVCIEPHVPSQTPKLKRLNLHVPEPIRICPEPVCPKPKVQEVILKKLPPYKPKPCPCIEPTPMKDVCLKRLPKSCPPEDPNRCQPKRICPVEKCERADENLSVKSKVLPVIQPKECPCVKPPPMKDVKLKRMVKVKVLEPPRVCPCIAEKCPCPRADDDWCMKKKPLREIVSGVCPCIETPMVYVNFKRLECIDYPKPCDAEDPCIPYQRADFGCWEYYTPEKEEEKKVNGSCVQSRTIITSASDTFLNSTELLSKSAGTKLLQTSYSSKTKDSEKMNKCFLPTKMRLAAALKCAPRLPPCPVPEPCIRTDDNLCVKPKKLPKLEPGPCICIEPHIPSQNPKLKRLNLHVPEPVRKCPEPVCPKPKVQQVVHKKLPLYKPKPCPCIKPSPMKDVCLRRLPKPCPPEDPNRCQPKRICPVEKCERADENLCVKPKLLPVMPPKECPCVEPPPMKDVKLKRMVKVEVLEPPRVCPCDSPYTEKCPCPRADDNWCMKEKPLRKIVPGVCPCIETPMVDVNFKRLECIEYPEPCDPEDPCIPYQRADFGCWEYYTPETEEEKKKCNKGSKTKSKRKPYQRCYSTLRCSGGGTYSHAKISLTNKDRFVSYYLEEVSDEDSNHKVIASVAAE